MRIQLVVSINQQLPPPPSELFGGTWEQIKDVFLLAAGSNYTNGSTGGEVTHKLTTSEMPSHSHNQLVSGYSGWDSYTTSGYILNWATSTDVFLNKSASTVTLPHASFSNVNINANGGGQSHNNMPPYYTVYTWKRTT